MTASELHDLPVTRETVADLPDQPLAEGVSSLAEMSAHVAVLSRKEKTVENAIEPIRQSAEIVSNVATMTPMSMLNMAIERGAGIETLEKLMLLQERWEANQARKAFDEAIANAKAEISPVIRNATGHNNKRYADFAAIARTVDPIISKFGLSYRFRTAQADKISVTCVLSHKDGHSEETTLAGPADQSGNKNAIQAIGSTLTYLQRYSLVQALGLAAANDDDGKSAGAVIDEGLTKEEVVILLKAIDDTKSDAVKLCQYYKIDAIADLPKSRYDEALALINRGRKQA